MKFVPSERNIKVLDGKLQFDASVIDFNEQWHTVDLLVPDEIAIRWAEIEQAAQEYAEFPWKSAMEERRLRVKIDDRTMFFDSKSELIPGCQKVSVMAEITCILEIKSVYNFKGQSGLTCRIHQLKIREECIL